MQELQVCIGWDSREVHAYHVARWSMARRSSHPLNIVPLMMEPLRRQGFYWRQHEKRDGKLWDVISDAPMSTEFAITRFLTPHVHREGWTLFVDADVVVLTDIAELFALADDRYAVMCVKHDHRPAEAEKMDGQVQTAYPRKNWSSVMLFNADHPANNALTLDYVNSVPGRELHAFAWLKDEEIGEIPPEWNHLVGVQDDRLQAKIAHFTLGIPEMVSCDSRYRHVWEQEEATLWSFNRPVRAAA